MTQTKTMKNSLVALFLVLVMALSLFGVVTFAASAAGGGSCTSTESCTGTYDTNGFCTICTGYEAAKPVSDTHHPELNETHNGYYAIENAGQLYWFADKVDNENTTYGNVNVVLTKDITVNEGTVTAESTGMRVWSPIGDWDHQYGGTFDGNSKTISGLYYNDDSSNSRYVALFACVAESGIVKNVTVTNSVLVGATYTAAIVGHNYGTVTGCVNNAPVSGSSYSAGIVSYNSGTVELCGNTGTIYAGWATSGGIVARNMSVSGRAAVVKNCWNTGSVSSAGNTVGGIVGQNSANSSSWPYARVENCWSTGSVSGTESVGGVSGNNWRASVSNCYSVSAPVGVLEQGASTTKTAQKTLEQFASGEVAYLLGSAFGQTLSGNNRDATPVFATTTNKVYQLTNCDGVSIIYRNTATVTEHQEGVTAANYFNADGTCKVCGAQAAASVLANGTTSYFSDLQTALSSDAAKSGTADAPATVTLLSDASAESGFSIYDAHIILDLNGFNVNCTNNYGKAINVTYRGITIRGNGTVTGYEALYSENAIVKVEGGTLEGSYYGISASGGELHISGGTVSGGRTAINYSELSAFTISGGTFRGKFYDNKGGGSAVQPVITGGSFPEGIVLGANCPALSTLLGEGYCYCDADEKKVTLTDGQKEITGSVTVKKDISGATVTVEDITFTYDGTAKEPEVSVQLSDDTLSKGVDYEIEYSNNINAGTATVTVIGIGAYAGEAEATFTVNKKAVTVTAEDKSICVDGTYEFTFTVEGLVGDDTLTVNPELTTNASVTTAGEYDITASGADAGENYSITYVGGKLTVNAHSWVYTAVEHIIYEKCSVCNTDGGVLELGWNTDNHVYDGNDKRVNIQKETLVGKEIWDVDYRIDNSLTAVQIINAGTYTATASVGGATATMTFEILKATPSYTTPTELAATYGDTLADIQLPPGFSWQVADTTRVGNAGNNTFLVIFTPDDTKNYNVVTDIEVTVAVGKKSVTVTAESKEVEQFTALPEFTYTVDGMLDGDTFTTAPVAGVTITDTKTIGEYEITVSGGENSNYEFNYVGAKLTVTEHTEHRDGTATCTNKAVCGICGEDYGALLEHDYAAATCTVPKTCNDCGATTGEALGHAYDNACDTACNTCGEERTPAEHIDADENNACDVCGAELPKDGLSGGAIAGIAVGSAAVVGGGGFALFWFVIKKKKWADLLAVFKK